MATETKSTSLRPWGSLPDDAVLVLPEGWEVAICQPSTSPAPDCQPTVLQKHGRHGSDSEFRGACLGCGWIGPVTTGENLGSEAACDHTHPGWRDLPVIEPLRNIDGGGASAAKARDKQLRELTRIYPPGWAERCGPIITWRSPHGTRHVPNRNPWGGFDMARERRADVSSAEVHTQMALF